MKKPFVRGLRRLALVSLFAAGLGTTASAQVKSTIVLGSTSATSSHYAAAVSMGQALKEGVPGASVTVLETGSTVDNIRRMVRGEIDVGLVSSDGAVLAIDGIGQFEGRPVPDLVVVYTYDEPALNIAVRADSGITELRQLAGQKFSPGFRASGTELFMKGAFDLLKIQPNWVPGSLKDAVEGIQNRQLVGYAKYGVGTTLDATLREIMTSAQMRLLGFTPDQEQLISSNIKGISFVTLPANLIPGQPAMRAAAIQSLYMTRLSLMTDDTAFAIAKAIYEKRQYIIEVFPHLKDFNFKTQALKAETMGLKIHPGAKRFWQGI